MEKTELETMKEKLANHESRLQTIEKMLEGKTNIAPRRTALNEFLLQKKPTNDVEKTLVIAYYLEIYKDVKVFSAADIEQGYREAREPPPSNINDKINLNIKKGYLTEVPEKKDNKKAWSLTNSGLKSVEEMS